MSKKQSTNLLLKGKKKTKILADIDAHNDDNDDHGSSISGFHGDYFSKHRSCRRHLAASLHGVQGKLSKKDVMINKTCGRKHSKSRGRRLAKQCSRMDDAIFNNHLENIWCNFSEDKRASFAYVDSLCFWLHHNKPTHGLELIKRKDIFSKKYVFVPIVCWDHWRLVIFCHFDQARCSKTRTRCILLLDSIEMGAQEIGPHVRKFVFDIFKSEGRPESKDVIYRIPLLVPKVPQQTNEVDCGRFVLYFIKLFMEAAPENFSISDGYPYFLTPNWFDPESFGEFCDKLIKDIPRHKQGVGVARRFSQRVRNTRVYSRKSFGPQNREVILVDDTDETSSDGRN